MILAAMALAAALDAAAIPVPQVNPLILKDLKLGPILPPIVEKMPNGYQPPGAGCQYIAQQVRNDQREVLKKLGSLRDGTLMYAVERKIGGCGVPTPVGYHPPSLPGKADAPAMREDAPSNRR